MFQLSSLLLIRARNLSPKRVYHVREAGCGEVENCARRAVCAGQSRRRYRILF